jgi:hypothetical protein
MSTGTGTKMARIRTPEDESRNRLQGEALLQYVQGQQVTCVQPGTVHAWTPKKES